MAKKTNDDWDETKDNLDEKSVANILVNMANAKDPVDKKAEKKKERRII